MLSVKEINELIQHYIFEREILHVKPAYLFDNAQLFGNKGYVNVQPNIQATVLYDPVSGQIGQSMENGTQRVTHRDPLEIIEPVIVANADGVYVVPAGEYKKVLQVYTDLAATGVAARDFTLTIVKNIAGAALVNIMVTGAVALTDGQDGSIFMSQSGPTWLNDNGVITNEDTNISGLILGPADTVTATWTNKDANDLCRMQVVAIDYPNMLVL